jgi:hypothetical protein
MTRVFIHFLQWFNRKAYSTTLPLAFSVEEIS